MTTLKEALEKIPEGLLKPLLREYEEALDAGRAGKWEVAGLKAGKLCEIIYTILKGHVDGQFVTKPDKPKNMVSACLVFEQADPKIFSRAVRIQMPRLLIAIYELRNNRDIGHVGGDVDPNKMDGEFFVRSIKWLVAELVRLFHSVDINEAAELVEIVSQRSLPQVWEKDGVIRVLNPKMGAKDKTILVLYHLGQAVAYGKLFDAVEYSHKGMFVKSVLNSLHKEKMIDLNRKTGLVTLLPPGEQKAEMLLTS